MTPNSRTLTEHQSYLPACRRIARCRRRARGHISRLARGIAGWLHRRRRVLRHFGLHHHPANRSRDGRRELLLSRISRQAYPTPHTGCRRLLHPDDDCSFVHPDARCDRGLQPKSRGGLDDDRKRLLLSGDRLFRCACRRGAAAAHVVTRGRGSVLPDVAVAPAVVVQAPLDAVTHDRCDCRSRHVVPCPFAARHVAQS